MPEIKINKNVFAFGCENVNELAPAVKRKLDEFMKERSTVYVGNREGTEELVQDYLRKKEYEDVTIVTTPDDDFKAKMKGRYLFPSEDDPEWLNICIGKRSKDKKMYRKKMLNGLFDDRKNYEYMIEECVCGYGLTVWDGKSSDVFLNILDMIFLSGNVWVLMTGENGLKEIRTFEDVQKLLPAKKGNYIGYSDLLPVDMFERIISDCTPSKDMRRELRRDPSRKKDIVQLILNAPVEIQIKKRCLAALAKTEDMYRDLVEECKSWDEMNGADIETCQAQFIYGRVKEHSATDYLKLIEDALCGLININPGEILYLKEAWYDEEVIDEYMKEKGMAAFTSFKAAKDYVRAEMKEEEWDEDTLCWTVLEKWIPGYNGVMDKIYTYYLIGEKVVYISFENHENYNRDRFASALAGKYNGICDVARAANVPFEVGDMVVLDQRPFAPVRHGLIIWKGSCPDDNYVLYKNKKGFWEERNLAYLILAGEAMYSCYYNLESFEGELPASERILKKVQDFILTDDKGKGKGYRKRKRKRGAKIDDLFVCGTLGNDKLTDEDLEEWVQKNRGTCG